MPSSPQPVADVLADLQQVFARLELRWFVFGAQAAILHGVARLSADVDVTVDLAERPPGELVEALAAAGFELRVTDADGAAGAKRGGVMDGRLTGDDPDARGRADGGPWMAGAPVRQPRVAR